MGRVCKNLADVDAAPKAIQKNAPVAKPRGRRVSKTGPLSEDSERRRVVQSALSPTDAHGNPLNAVDRAAQSYALIALEHLALIAQSSESETIRVSAIREILNRGLGRVSVRKRQFDEDGLPVPTLKIIPFADGSHD